MKTIQNQQTVKLAIDCTTGEIVAAEALLALSEIEFTSLRREAMAARLDRRRGVTLPLKTGVHSPIIKRQIYAAPPTSVVRTASD